MLEDNLCFQNLVALAKDHKRDSVVPEGSFSVSFPTGCQLPVIHSLKVNWISAGRSGSRDCGRDSRPPVLTPSPLGEEPLERCLLQSLQCAVLETTITGLIWRFCFPFSIFKKKIPNLNFCLNPLFLAPSAELNVGCI